MGKTILTAFGVVVCLGLIAFTVYDFTKPQRLPVANCREYTEDSGRTIDVKRNSNTIHIPLEFKNIPVYCPEEWTQIQKTVGAYDHALNQDGLAFVAAEAHDSAAAYGAEIGPSYAFWLWNMANFDMRVIKVTFLFYGEGFVPISGFIMTPPKGQEWIHLEIGKGCVLPLWPKKKDDLPNQIIVLVERDGLEKVVFSMVGLRNMMEIKYDNRKIWVKKGMNEIQQQIIQEEWRVIHPRYYSMGSSPPIDIGHGSEVFIGPGGAQEVYYDLGHDEKWYEVSTLTEDKLLQAIITPLGILPMSIALDTE